LLEKRRPSDAEEKHALPEPIAAAPNFVCSSE